MDPCAPDGLCSQTIMRRPHRSKLSVSLHPPNFFLNQQRPTNAHVFHQPALSASHPITPAATMSKPRRTVKFSTPSPPPSPTIPPPFTPALDPRSPPLDPRQGQSLHHPYRRPPARLQTPHLPRPRRHQPNLPLPAPVARARHRPDILAHCALSARPCERSHGVCEKKELEGAGLDHTQARADIPAGLPAHPRRVALAHQLLPRTPRVPGELEAEGGV